MIQKKIVGTTLTGKQIGEKKRKQFSLMKLEF